ncbi:MAG: hypothetical protein HOP09_12140 [Hyphomicrobium sp.]|nr:hypothetical protein [Hyphomicrobium sp.]
MLRNVQTPYRSRRDVSVGPAALDVLFEIVFAIVRDSGRVIKKWLSAASSN